MLRLITIAFCLFSGLTQAQVKTEKKPVGNAPVNKLKPPVLTTALAKFSGEEVRINAEVAKQIITLPLRITDVQNNSYAISSYQFAYKRLGVKENEQTGQISQAVDYRADRFNTSPIPALWISYITEQLHRGEELWFFDIIVKNSQGRLFFAPNMKLIID